VSWFHTLFTQRSLSRENASGPHSVLWKHRSWTGSQACWLGADAERHSQLRRLESVPHQPGFL